MEENCGIYNFNPPQFVPATLTIQAITTGKIDERSKIAKQFNRKKCYNFNGKRLKRNKNFILKDFIYYDWEIPVREVCWEHQNG